MQDVNFQVLDGKTALHIECERKDISLGKIEELIKLGADLSIKEKELNAPPIFFACANPNSTVEIIKLLLETNNQSKMTDNLGRNLLHIACRIKEPKLEILKLLLEKGVDPNLRSEEYTISRPTPLDWLFGFNKASFEIVELLVNNGAEINDSVSPGENFLNYICYYRKPDARIINLFFNKGLNLNAKNPNGFTTLHTACLNPNMNLDCIKFLVEVENSSVLNSNNIEGLTPMHVLFLNECIGFDSLENIALFLLEKNARLDIQDHWGNTPFHYLCQNKNISDKNFTSLMEKTQIDIQIDIKNKKGLTPLHIACAAGNLNIIKFLVEKNADVNIKNIEGNSPLFCASLNMEGSVDLFEFLIKKGAVLNTRNEKGQTALHLVCLNLNKAAPVVKFLLDKKNLAGHEDKLGKTPLDYACKFHQYRTTIDLNVILLLLMKIKNSDSRTVAFDNQLRQLCLTTFKVNEKKSHFELFSFFRKQIIDNKGSCENFLQEFFNDYFNLKTVTTLLLSTKRLEKDKKNPLPKYIWFEIIKKCKEPTFFQGDYKNPKPTQLGNMTNSQLDELIAAMEKHAKILVQATFNNNARKEFNNDNRKEKNENKSICSIF